MAISTIDSTGLAPDGAWAPAGSVIQVTDISTTRATQSTTSASFVPISNLSITISPKKATSSIYVFFSVHMYHVSGGGGTIGLYKDGVLISDESSTYENYTGASDIYTRINRVIQVPADNTNSRVYTLGFKVYNSVTCNINQGAFQSYMYAMEIAG